MAKHDSLYPLILAEAPGCPLPTVRMMINRAAAHLCERSLIWREQLEPVSVQPGQGRYELEMPQGASLVTVEAAQIDGVLIGQISDNRGARLITQASGPPRRLAITPDSLAVLLDPIPVAEGELILELALKPRLDSPVVPDIVADRYYEAAAEGAKGFLKRMSGQPWSDPGGAAFSLQEFERLVSEARIATEFGRARGSLSVNVRPFGG